MDHLKVLGVPHSSFAVVPEAEIDIDISQHSTSMDADEANDTVVPPKLSSDQNETNSSTGGVVMLELDLSPLPESTQSNSGASPTPEMTSTHPCCYLSRSHWPPKHFDTQTWWGRGVVTWTIDCNFEPWTCVTLLYFSMRMLIMFAGPTVHPFVLFLVRVAVPFVECHDNNLYSDNRELSITNSIPSVLVRYS